jgi:antibiotic biosynthesis monooxygenase (ABM) superfamily enzyme
MENQSPAQVVLIDIFVIPEESKEVFLEKTRTAQSVIKALPGFIEGYVYVKSSGPSQYNVVTTAVWENEDAMANARTAIATSYEKIGFNPQTIMQELGVQVSRATYSRIAY